MDRIERYERLDASSTLAGDANAHLKKWVNLYVLETYAEMLVGSSPTMRTIGTNTACTILSMGFSYSVSTTNRDIAQLVRAES